MKDVLRRRAAVARAIKQTVKRTAHLPPAEAQALKLPALVAALNSEDAEEGVLAFREKRAARLARPLTIAYRASDGASSMHAAILRYFSVVARSGSIRKASEELHVATSALSRQIQKLEDELGTPLFERLPKGLRLTRAGEAVLEHADRTLQEFEVLRGELGALKGVQKRPRQDCLRSTAFWSISCRTRFAPSTGRIRASTTGSSPAPTAGSPPWWPTATPISGSPSTSRIQTTPS